MREWIFTPLVIINSLVNYRMMKETTKVLKEKYFGKQLGVKD